jgi:hypothetical protein
MNPTHLQPAVATALQAWHHYLETNAASDLAPLLAEEVVFRSPVAHSPYPGRKAITLVLTTVNQVFENFKYHREFVSDDGLNVVLEFSAEIGGKGLKGADFIQFNADGKIVEFEVMVRPASGLMALRDEMGARLGSAQATLKGE